MSSEFLWQPVSALSGRLMGPASKQPLKLPTTKNDLAATQELPDPFLSAFSRSFSSNDVWINYRHCRHSNRNHLKYWPMQSSSRAQLENSTVFESDRKKLDKGCKWKSLAWRSMQCKASWKMNWNAMMMCIGAGIRVGLPPHSDSHPTVRDKGRAVHGGPATLSSLNTFTVSISRFQLHSKYWSQASLSSMINRLLGCFHLKEFQFNR